MTIERIKELSHEISDILMNEIIDILEAGFSTKARRLSEGLWEDYKRSFEISHNSYIVRCDFGDNITEDASFSFLFKISNENLSESNLEKLAENISEEELEKDKRILAYDTDGSIHVLEQDEFRHQVDVCEQAIRAAKLIVENLKPLKK